MGIEKIIKSNEVDVNINQFFIGRIVESILKGLAWFCENVLCIFSCKIILYLVQ